MKLIHAVKTKPLKTTEAKTSVEFSIGNAGKIIEILRSKIYSHPIRTLVQEYLCNARDAVREVKGTKIVVTLPSDDKPSLSIRDYGPGIDKDRMLNNFVQYGSSTKESSNNQTGGFGLGSKLAWAYTDSFDITTYVNGIKSVYRAHINESKNGTLDLLAESETSEPNGTCIEVPVERSDFDDFFNATRRATILWNKNEQPEFIHDNEPYQFEEVKPLELTESVSIYLKSDLTHSFGEYAFDSHQILSIDGIAYPLSNQFIREHKALDKFVMASDAVAVIRVGNGQVEIAASRESISENSRTFTVMQTKVKQAIAALDAWKSKQLASVTSLVELTKVAKFVRGYAKLDTAMFTDSEGEVYTLNFGWNTREKATISSAKIAMLDVKHFESDGSKKRRSRYNNTSIYSDTLIIISDESLSQARQTMKVTQAMNEAMVSAAILVSKGSTTLEFAKRLTIQLDGRLLSDIELPKVEREPANRTPDGFVKVQMFNKKGYGDRKTLYDKTILLEQNTDKFVYILASERGDLDQYESLRKLLSDSRIGLCLMGVNGIKQVKDLPEFIPLETFLATPKKHLAKGEYKDLLSQAAAHWINGIATDKLEPIGKDAEALATIKDTVLATYIKTVSDNQTNSYGFGLGLTNDFLMDHLVKTESSIAALKDLNTIMPEYIKDNYPMIHAISRYNESVYEEDNSDYNRKRVPNPVTEKQYNAEIIAYLNGKYDSRGVK